MIGGVTSPIWGPPPSRKQTLNGVRNCAVSFLKRQCSYWVQIYFLSFFIFHYFKAIILKCIIYGLHPHIANLK